MFFYFLRKKYCTINQDCTWNQPICHAQNVLNSVRYMTIHDLKVIDNRSQYFPNVIEFTFDSRYFNSWTLFSTNGFGRMIPLVHLHKLNMNSIYLNFNILINILLHASNVHTLTVQTLEITVKEVSALVESENFRLVSKQNKIKNISISNYLVVTIKTLINLCPRLHHLSLGTDRQPFEATIRYLRSNTNETVCHVSSLSLYMFNVNPCKYFLCKNASQMKPFLRLDAAPVKPFLHPDAVAYRIASKRSKNRLFYCV